VLSPEERVDVAKAVVAPLPKVRDDDNEEELDNDSLGAPMLLVGKRVLGAVSLGERAKRLGEGALLGQIDGCSRTEGGSVNALEDVEGGKGKGKGEVSK
jgi:hypothetical protein